MRLAKAQFVGKLQHSADRWKSRAAATAAAGRAKQARQQQAKAARLQADANKAAAAEIVRLHGTGKRKVSGRYLKKSTAA